SSTITPPSSPSASSGPPSVSLLPSSAAPSASPPPSPSASSAPLLPHLSFPFFWNLSAFEAALFSFPPFAPPAFAGTPPAEKRLGEAEDPADLQALLLGFHPKNF